MSKPSPLISPREAGDALGISPATVRAIVRAGHWACIGACAVQQEGSTRWHYTIPRAGFERLVAGDLAVIIQIGKTEQSNDKQARDFWAA